MKFTDLTMKRILSDLNRGKLTAEHQTLIKDYLSGSTDSDSLKSLTDADYQSFHTDNLYKIMLAFLQEENYEEARALFHVLFAIGQSDSSRWLPVREMENHYAQLFTPQTAYQFLAIYTDVSIYNSNQIYSSVLQSLESFEIDFEGLKKAIECQKGYTGTRNRAILLAIYFKRKYTNKMLEEEKGIVPPIEKEDQELFHEYEEAAINNIQHIFDTWSFDTSSKEALSEEIHGAMLDDDIDRIKKLSKSKAASIVHIGARKEACVAAYLNFPLSNVLKNIVRLGFYVGVPAMLHALFEISHGLNVDIEKIGGDFDRLFGFETRDYIVWAASEGCKELLAKKLHTDREIYLSLLNIDMEKDKERNISTALFEVLREQEPILFEEFFAQKTQNGGAAAMEELADGLTSRYSDPLRSSVRNYLLSGENFDTAFQHLSWFIGKGHFRLADKNLLENHIKLYGENEFTYRCRIYMIFKGIHIEEAEINELYGFLDREGLGLEKQLSLLDILHDAYYYKEDQEAFADIIRPIFVRYLKERREETINTFRQASIRGRQFALTVLEADAEINKQEILSYTQDSTKAVRETLIDVLYLQRGWEEDVKKLLSDKKKTVREIGERVLQHWDETTTVNIGNAMGFKYQTNAMNNTSNTAAKVSTTGVSGRPTTTCAASPTTTYAAGMSDGPAVTSATSISNVAAAVSTTVIPDAATANMVSASVTTSTDLVAKLHRGGKKRSLRWVYEAPMPTVHKTDGSEASQEYLQAILLCYSTAENPGPSEDAAFLAQALDGDELAIYMVELFGRWVDTGSNKSKRWVLYATAIHGGAPIVKRFYRQIQEWLKLSRSVFAAAAVTALSLNPTLEALLTLDDMARSFKSKRVREAAREALENTAARLGISREELDDRMVPDLGFNESMERTFDYGGRSFTVTVTPALTLQVSDENGRKLKNLPAAGKLDDPEKAGAARESFAQLKQQIKAVTDTQKKRLETALFVRRSWDADTWKSLFVSNPIMHQFAINLIWGLYKDDSLVQSFRYMEDGSFNTENEEEYELPGEGRIALVHPAEMTEASLLKWRRQLEDYEIKQPILQLERPFRRLEENELNRNTLERFQGCQLNEVLFDRNLLKMGWLRGNTESGGAFYTYFRQDKPSDFRVKLHFSGSVNKSDGNNEITVYQVDFYRVGADDEEQVMALKDVPPGYFSEIVMQLERIVAPSTAFRI